MRIGNVTGDIYDRSVYKKLNRSRQSMLNGAASGEDCAIFAVEDGAARLFTAQTQTCYTGPECGKYAVYAAANQATAFGASKLAGVLLHVLLPASVEEQALRRIVEDADRAAGQLGTAVADVKASVTAAVKEAIVTAAAVGWNGSEAKEADTLFAGNGAAEGAGVLSAGNGAAEGAGVLSAGNGAVKGAGVLSAGNGAVKGAGVLPAGNRVAKRTPALSVTEGAQVVMTKWAGLEGSAMLACRCKDRLRERYPSYLIEEAAGFDRFLSIVPEAAVAGKSGVGAMCAAAEGGIFRGLWTIAQRAGVGLEIDLKKIPIRQETVEICNHLDINPYELVANGSLLCLTEHGEALVKELERVNIPAAVIGTVTANRDRVIVNGEERRFLEPAKTDEIYKLLG